MMLRKALRSNGYAVVGEAASAQEAIRIATTIPLDLILMDVNLQGPMDGIEAAHRILSDRFIPVVMVSALVDREQVQRAFEAGACAYISKPVTSQNLIPMLAAILSQAPVAHSIAEARARFDAASGNSLSREIAMSPNPPLL